MMAGTPSTPSAADAPRQPCCAADLLMAAALALPGLAASIDALSQSTPDQGTIAYKNLDYTDAQPLQRRMHVNADMFYLYIPVKDRFALEASTTTETMSGASPRFLNTLSGASNIGIRENRAAADLKLTGFLRRASIALQTASSRENDYLSSATTLETRVSSEDNNTTLTFAATQQGDDISATGLPLIHERRVTRAYLAGVTQVLSPVSIVQSNITYGAGHGYFSDPYKLLDNRPRERGQFAWLLRYNHFLPQSESALHLDYRYYGDTWAVRAHTIDAKYYYPLGDKWMLRPRLRYYTQKAASFYSGVFPPAVFGQTYSADQRLASFGAFHYGVGLSRELENGLSIDLKVERYEQRTSSQAFGADSAQLLPFRASIVAFGLTKKF